MSLSFLLPRILSCLLTLCWLPGLNGQASVRGQITDRDNGSPIPFATVFFDGTTLGTTTDESGNYELSVDRAELPVSLVVTHLNYRSARVVLTGPENVNFQLSPTPTVTATVEVGDLNARKDNLREFNERYLGNGEWGRRSRIFNPEVLLFDRDYEERRLPESDRVLALADPPPLRHARWSADSTELTYDEPVNLQARSLSPLEIDLPDLGYRLTVDLIRFVVDYRTTAIRFIGSYYYRPYEGSGPPDATHAKNRRLAYYNSPQHFLRALYYKRLAEEGYAVFAEGESGMEPIDLYHHLRPGPEPDLKVIAGLKGREIIVLYYGNRRGRPVPPGRRFLVSPVTSRMLPTRSSAVIRSDGTMPGEPIPFSGALGDVAISRLLPADYVAD